MPKKDSEIFNKSTILVCGGSGFIGSNFIRYILSKYPKAKIINLDGLSYAGSKLNLSDFKNSPRYEFVKGDITNYPIIEKTIKKHRVSYAVNFAAATHVDKSIHNGSLGFINSNIIGVHNLLEAVKKSPWVKKYVQISTDEVFGALGFESKAKFRETNPFAPNNPYSATKAGGDLLCRAYFVTWGVPVVVTHSANNFGPYQYPEKLIPFFVLRMMENRKLPIYGDGKNTRDWIYVLDNCRGIELCLLKGKPGETYNIGADNEKNNFEIARMILDYFGKDESWIEFVADRPGHDRRYALDSSKIKKELGWKPKFKFETAFYKTIDWYVKNQSWIKSIKKRETLNPHIKQK